jgi:S-DNA-T family DNA segregation ATPase FtsK/SpoIIIE
MANKRAQSKSSASRASKSSSTQRRRSDSGGRASTGRSRATQPKQASRSRAQARPWLSPQQQREMFSFVLIGLGLLLLVLLGTTDRGVVGAGIVGLIQRSFGSSGVIVPIALMIVGGLILWQERFIDAPITGGNVTGVALLMLVLLCTTEFSSTSIIFRDNLDSPRSIGGAIDLGLMMAFGVAGAGVLIALVFILGVMLTFNVTLRQILATARAPFRALFQLLWSPKYEEVSPDDELEPEPVPFAEELKNKRAPRPTLQQSAPAKLAAVPSADEPQREMIFTPIAARPTQASLFAQRSAADPASAATGETTKLDPAQSVPAKRALLANAETQRIELPATAQAAPAAATATATPGASYTPVQPAAPAAKGAKPAAPDDDSGIAEIDASGPRQAWPMPSVTLLDDFSESEVDDNEKRSKARVIEDTLASFKIEAQVVGMNPGPAVTQYLLQPAVGVKVSRITGLDRDLALALAAPSVRIEAPIPGTPHIGIEIPNSAIASVSMREVIDTDEFTAHQGRLRLALGKDVSGTPVITDLTRAPHLLIAGSTGSGKSVAVNSIVCTLLMNNTPDDLKFIMVDPKMVELIVYNNIPHLLAPVVTELERVVSLLKWAVREMERRYKLLAQKGFRNIDSYNKVAKKGGAGLEPLPYIVIIIDELADLMMMAPDEVETLVCRLAQMARAIGIHLILATQRPSVDVVTGLIKANFPTRMAFGVTSQIDSRVILDQTGAEHLLGRGDMLYLASDAPKPIRVQGTFVSDREIEVISRFWRAAQKPAEPTSKPLPLKPRGDHATTETSTDQERQTDGSAAVVAIEMAGVSPLPDSHSGQLSDVEQDELLPKAIQLVRQHERASASLLQRRLRIGYSKAAQLIEMLEQRGIVGPAEGGRSREVLSDNPLGDKLDA